MRKVDGAIFMAYLALALVLTGVYIQAARNADAMRVCERTENTETCYNIINN